MDAISDQIIKELEERGLQGEELEREFTRLRGKIRDAVERMLEEGKQIGAKITERNSNGSRKNMRLDISPAQKSIQELSVEVEKMNEKSKGDDEGNGKHE